MRLIDADKLKEKYSDYWDREIEHPKYQDTFGSIIDNEPTVEKRPNGKWEDHNNDMFCSCSNCGKTVFSSDADKYCPSCGASMRKFRKCGENKMSLCQKCVKRDLCPYVAEDVFNLEQCAYYSEERPHGKWKEDSDDYDVRCSHCGIAIHALNKSNHEYLNELTGGKWWTHYRYCPVCGSENGGDE